MDAISTIDPVRPASSSALASPADTSKEALADYLRDSDWEKELNYKTWITKAARFCAAKRLAATADVSNKAQTFLSAYLIIIGMVPFFVPAVNKTFTPELVGISTAGIFILLLAYNQIEGARSYALKAYRHHECGLRVGRLYDLLRQAKMIEDPVKKRAEL
jgi:hypothetical protein